MPDRARVNSLDAIESFRAQLIIYRELAGRLLDEVGDDVLRVRQWLEGEGLARWQREVRRLQFELEQRQQELFSARLSQFQEPAYARQAEVQKARRALRAAEERVELVKHWRRQFDQRVEPLARQAEKLRHNLTHDLGAATTTLAEMSSTLRDYAELTQSPAKAPAPAGNPEPTPATGPATEPSGGTP